MAVWLLASRVLGRPVVVDESYPHVCGLVVGEHAGEPTVTAAQDCARCAADTPWSPSRRRHLRSVRRA